MGDCYNSGCCSSAAIVMPLIAIVGIHILTVIYNTYPWLSITKGYTSLKPYKEKPSGIKS